jgi:hypothetical protein
MDTLAVRVLFLREGSSPYSVLELGDIIERDKLI